MEGNIICITFDQTGCESEAKFIKMYNGLERHSKFFSRKSTSEKASDRKIIFFKLALMWLWMASHGLRI